MHLALLCLFWSYIVFTVLNESICVSHGLLFKTWRLHYPQCNLATEWHQGRQFIRLHVASSGGNWLSCPSRLKIYRGLVSVHLIH